MPGPVRRFKALALTVQSGTGVGEFVGGSCAAGVGDGEVAVGVSVGSVSEMGLGAEVGIDVGAEVAGTAVSLGNSAGASAVRVAMAAFWTATSVSTRFGVAVGAWLAQADNSSPTTAM